MENELTDQKLRTIRVCLFFFAVLAVVVMGPPMKGSLKESQATVVSAQQLIGRFDIQYALSDGQILKENFKTNFLGQGETNRSALLALQGTNEKLNVWHKNIPENSF